MSNKLKAAWWFLTGVSAIFMGVWALVGEPNWWGTAVAIAVAVSSVIFGKPWQPPQGP